MGGDLGPRPCVCAAIKFVQAYPDTHIQLHGDADALAWCRTEYSPLPSSISLHQASSVVTMSEQPAVALRQRRDSSMWQALNSLAKDEAHAGISAGNTGALMAMSRHLVAMLPEIRRPAIGKWLPTRTGASLLLDLGANLVCSADNLVQFAVMGSAAARVAGIRRPRVALLNVGSEMSKGSEPVQLAAERLRAHNGPFEFVGFVEGDELYSGDVDVIVCDGFSGNVALKVSEGLVRHLTASLNEFFNAGPLRRLARLALGPMLKRWSQNRNPSLYNGAAFLGLRKTVIKSHGSADTLGLFFALKTAREQVEAAVPDRIAAAMAQDLHT